MSSSLSFHRFAPRHLDDALRLSREAGWPHRIEDWSLITSISNGIVAMEDGQVVGTALATPFGPVAMANMIIVDERMRGRGLGRQIMERAMALAQPQEWRLSATEAGLPLYEKLGFTRCGTILQHQGPVSAVDRPDGIRWAEAADMGAVLDMDRAATGADRASLFGSLKAGRIAVAAGKGYAVLRPFGRGHVVGPVIADDADTARRLLSFALAGHEGAFMRVDTDAEAGLSDWLEQFGLPRTSSAVAMRRGEPQEGGGRLTGFALAAQALG